ncbi:MAG: ribosome recycling factor [Clostridia bacterium]|nr:ribosome recycling factor [Clostridia bacterium]
MTDEILDQCEIRMERAVKSLGKEFGLVRAGRANPALLEKIDVDYYGVQTPINQVSNISAPEARLLVIQPWDKSILGEIEKAILKSDLGLIPNNDGNIIRISIPQLTEERRKKLVKLVRKMTEDSRVAVRNIRREANDELRNSEKSGDISQDESRRLQDEVQNLTDKYIEKINEVLATKEEEIMEV